MNISELRNELAKSIQELRAGSLEVKVATEITNAAGKMINSAKVEIEYNKQLKKDKVIPFLEQTNDHTS